MKSKSVLMAVLMASCFGFFARGEEKNCSVKGMHCEACISMVKDKVCNDSYEVCDVTMKSKAGQLHLKTKAEDGKINEAEISKALADTTYSIGTCQAKKGKG